MPLGILVDIDQQTSEVFAICDRNPFEGPFEQWTGSPVGLIDRFGICIEEIRELLRWIRDLLVSRFSDSDLILTNAWK